MSEYQKPKRIIYPPVWVVIGLIAIFTLDEYLPLARFTGSFGWYLGGFAIVIGLIMLVHAGGSFKVAETDLVPFKNVTSLVTGGVYRVTRNPMYLGMALVLLGTAITVGAFSALFVPPIFMAIIELRFIRPEEEMLAGIFGEDFAIYCKNVRRWI
jgi:protein-S-isoprenylcysteine O-methyltransferase Ste14